jgi:hypothetical protein
MLPFRCHHLPGSLSPDEPGDSRCDFFDNIKSILGHRRPALHDSDEARAFCMLDIMIGYIILNIWQHNMQQMEKRLHHHRHKAIANPSLVTFAPLTLLRRNLADLEDALRAAKSGFIVATRRDILHLSIKHNDPKTESTEARYDILLGQAKAMSIMLTNEIQLVIGSVTIQVPDLSKLHELSHKLTDS